MLGAEGQQPAEIETAMLPDRWPCRSCCASSVRCTADLNVDERLPAILIAAQDLAGQRGHVNASIAFACTKQGSCENAK